MERSLPQRIRYVARSIGDPLAMRGCAGHRSVQSYHVSGGGAATDARDTPPLARRRYRARDYRLAIIEHIFR